MPTVLTGIDVAAQRRRAAVLDRDMTLSWVRLRWPA
jgi:hypothetical protein